MMTGNLTAEGRALLAKGITLNFTKMQIGDKNSNMSFDIPIRIEKIENGKAYITGVLDLSSVKQGFFWRECGLYAMDPQLGEILYNYAYSTKPDYIAASDSGIMEEILVSMIATVGSNTNVNVTIDESMVFTTKKQFDTSVKSLHVNVKEYGAVGDGVTDDSDAIQAAINFAITKTKDVGLVGVTIPNGKYRCTKSINGFGLRYLECKGDIMLENDSYFALGYNSASLNPVTYYINYISSIKVLGGKCLEVHITKTDELELRTDRNIATQTSIAYSDFYLGYISTFKMIGLNNGWINENAFHGGRFKSILMDGDYPHNNNIFYSPKLEGLEANINSGASNRFLNCRFEGSNTITFGENTYSNVFVRSWNSSATRVFTSLYVPYCTVVNNGASSNQVVSDSQMYLDKKDMVTLTCKSKKFNARNFYKVNENQFYIRSQTDIWRSGYIRVTEDFGMNLISDAELWRIFIYFYDEDFNTTFIDESDLNNAFFESYGALSLSSSKSYLVTSTNLSSIKFALTARNMPSNVAYIDIRVFPGASGNCTYANLELLTQKNTSIKLSPLNIDISKSDVVPTAGIWDLGEVVYNSNPTINSDVGWVCTTGGNPGVWKSIGKIQE